MLLDALFDAVCIPFMLWLLCKESSCPASTLWWKLTSITCWKYRLEVSWLDLKHRVFKMLKVQWDGWLRFYLAKLGDKEFKTFCDMLERSNHRAWADRFRQREREAKRTKYQKEGKKCGLKYVHMVNVMEYVTMYNNVCLIQSSIMYWCMQSIVVVDCLHGQLSAKAILLCMCNSKVVISPTTCNKQHYDIVEAHCYVVDN